MRKSAAPRSGEGEQGGLWLLNESLGDQVRWGPDGLVPAVAVDAVTGQVLMLAYVNREALEATLRTGHATYFSRSRGRLWMKGETSGNVQRVREVRIDCDGDALLFVVDQRGTGACHTGEWSCFFRSLGGQPGWAKGPASLEPEGLGAQEGVLYDARILDRLRAVIRDRRLHPRSGSYTSSLFERGIDTVLKKVAEESGEVILAAKGVDDLKKGQADPPRLGRAYDALAWEAADLLYHLLVALEAAELPPEAVWRELARRRAGQKMEG